MKQLYHLGISCHGETLFRHPEDVRAITNILALVAFSVDVEVWADALMATHLHIIVFAEEERVIVFGRRLKQRITKYHRCRYKGAGPLFDPPVFLVRLEGANHILAAVSYVLRNGMHHAQSATPFGYSACSVNDLFRKELGKTETKPFYTSRSDIAAFLPRFSDFPDRFAMDADGMILRESFEELHRVELYYKTPRSFLFQMNRLSSEEWEREQREDGTASAPITLGTIEPAADEKSVSAWLSNERGYHFRPDRKSDMEVCMIIDRDLMSRYPGKTVYQLDARQKLSLAGELKQGYHLPDSQIRRCLALPVRSGLS
ncbi:MAG: hypothetical protein K5910_08520 [Bacteroidales bacterium]|nr:hypothetical protein [Bacteroidales bacterium]